MSRKKFSVGAALLCDDIRVEDNGKYILIGVYSGAVVVPVLPFAIYMQVFVELRDMPLGDHAIVLKISFNDKIVGELGGNFTVIEEGSAFLPFPKMPIEMDQPGMIDVSAKVGDSAFQTLVKKPVRLAPPSSPVT